MNKYVLKFRKEGYIKYISHLDLVRVFHRCFKMCEIDLDYSKGFNPHPKMSFVQPLSLGYSSIGELLEFDLVEDITPDTIKSLLNDRLPKGIEVIDCKKYLDSKPLAGDVVSCEYRIYFPTDLDENIFNSLIINYLDSEEIITKKKIKKSNDYKDINIRPMIHSIKSYRAGSFLVMDAILDAGSQSNLNPDLVVDSFLKQNNINVNRFDVEIQRIKISFSNNFQL